MHSDYHPGVNKSNPSTSNNNGYCIELREKNHLLLFGEASGIAFSEQHDRNGPKVSLFAWQLWGSELDNNIL